MKHLLRPKEKKNESISMETIAMLDLKHNTEKNCLDKKMEQHAYERACKKESNFNKMF